MLIKVHSRQIIVRLLGECPLLSRCFDHPTGVLTVLEHRILIVVVDIRWRLLHRQFVRSFLDESVVREYVKFVIVLGKRTCLDRVICLIGHIQDLIAIL